MDIIYTHIILMICNIGMHDKGICIYSGCVIPYNIALISLCPDRNTNRSHITWDSIHNNIKGSCCCIPALNDYVRSQHWFCDSKGLCHAALIVSNSCNGYISCSYRIIVTIGKLVVYIFFQHCCPIFDNNRRSQ